VSVASRSCEEPADVEAPAELGGAVIRAAAAGSRVAELLRDGTLARYPSCPVCASRSRRPVFDNAGPNRYIRAIPSVAALSVREIRELLQVHRCEECSASYCDPWLSRRTSGRLYATGFGQHVQGWRIFHESLADSDVETHCYWQKHAWEWIRAAFGPVRSYAELNCPFTGLLTLFRRAESDPASYRRLVQASLRNARSGRRYPGGLGASFRRLLRPAVSARAMRLVGSGPVATPRERCLVIEPSSLCWGSNCISSGVSCHALAPDLLGAALSNFEDVCRDGIRFDVAVLTQLDHHFEPMALLDRFLEVSTVVMVAGHSSNRFTKQHLMAFGPETVQHLVGRGYAAVDLTNETVHPSKRVVNQCFLVSKQLEL